MILDEIVAYKRRELEETMKAVPLEKIKPQALRQAPARDFAAALRGDGLKIIAEVKKASPSKGVIREDFDPVEIAKTYASNGASAISVLTEQKYFQGKLSYLTDIRNALSGFEIPLLRKDFIIDPYQIFEARAAGADTVLLITAILKPAQITEYLMISRSLNMECLLEVHDEKELETALKTDAKIIGINNRNLKTMTVDISTTEKLRGMIPQDKLVVSESGIKTRHDMLRMQNIGVDAVLVGEAFTASKDIGKKLRELHDQG